MGHALTSPMNGSFLSCLQITSACKKWNFANCASIIKNNNMLWNFQYADLDEFLSENNIPDGLPGTHLGHSTGLSHRNDTMGHSAGLTLGLGHITTKRERSPSPSDCVSPDTINPPSPAESSECFGVFFFFAIQPYPLLIWAEFIIKFI